MKPINKKPPPCFLGIDPGRSCGVCVCDLQCKVISVLKIRGDKVDEIGGILDSHRPRFVVCEGPIPNKWRGGQNWEGYRTLEHSRSIWRILCEEREISYHEVNPSTWHAFFHLSGKRDAIKATSMMFAKQYAGKKTEIKSQDEADAVLIAQWAFANLVNGAREERPDAE